jgi:hypothetical protein
MFLSAISKGNLMLWNHSWTQEILLHLQLRRVVFLKIPTSHAEDDRACETSQFTFLNPS